MKHFLTVIVPDQKAVKYALKGETITIGRAGDNAISFKISAVSSHHLEIRKTESGYLVVDLDSTNGTTVNGERFTEHLLSDGDDMVIGTAVRAQYAAVADESTAATSPPAQILRPQVAAPPSVPNAPTVILKKPPTPSAAPAAQSSAQPTDPPADIQIRKMRPPRAD